MNTALRTIITSHKPAVPSWLKPNLVCYWDGAKRAGVYYPLTNLVTNGDFSNGTTGWFAYGGIIAVVNNVCEFTVSTPATTNRIDTETINTQPGNKYYVSFFITSPKTSSVIFLIGNTFKSEAVGLTAQVRTRISGIVQASSTISPLRLYCNYGTVVLSTGDKVLYENAMVYDLTAIFGAGQEPTTAEMDAILAADGTPYWGGTRNALCNPNGKYFWYDASGNNRHMKMSNLAYVGNSNLDGSGFNVDGVDDYGSIPDSPETRLTQGGTLCAWIKPRSAGELTARIIDKSTDTSATNGYSLYTSSGKYRIQINGGANTDSVENAIIYNRNQFIVATFSTTGRCIYVNCVDVTASGGTQTTLPPDVAGSVCIGNRAGNTDRTFDGQIGLAGICTRALTQVEIQYLFEATRKYYGV